MRRLFFGLGTAQYLLTAIAIAGLLIAIAHLHWQSALIIALGLAMSSDAIAIASLEEHAETASPQSRAVMVVVIYQCFMAIPVLAVISLGGVVGSLARYAASRMWPVDDGGFPWATLGVNVLGCALIGVLMVLVSEGGRGGRPAHPLVRPFLGVGVLGGFTTFSAYALDFYKLLEREEAGTAFAYAAGTVVGALGAVWLGASATRAVVTRTVAK